MTDTWVWKNKSGGRGGLLYDSGNWGDILKMLWLGEVVLWKRRSAEQPPQYTDPFAGAVHYPLEGKIAFRLAQCRSGNRFPQLDFLQHSFFDKKLWPSAASGAALLLGNGSTAEVWDADETRLAAWRETARTAAHVNVAENVGSGWDLVDRVAENPSALLLIDPYDFLTEWREYLSLVAEKSKETTTLLYLYNRSGKSREMFADYRRFRGKLDDLTGSRPKRIGRIAADAFLPDAHHEMVFLPCEEDVNRPDFSALLEKLAVCAFELHKAQTETSVLDC